MYKVKIIPHAQRDLDKLPSNIFNKIKTILLSLGSSPRPNGALKLIQQEGYRMRFGDYRILYRIDDALKEVYIYRIKHRKEAYR